MIVSTKSERLAGPDMQVHCPSCDRETRSYTYELEEGVFVFSKGPFLTSRNTWVQCSRCGERRLSQVPPKRLQKLNAWQLSQLVGGDIPARSRQLTIGALATCFIPVLGLGLAALAVLDTLKIKRWPQLASRVGLGLALVFNVGFAALAIGQLLPATRPSVVADPPHATPAQLDSESQGDRLQRALANFKPGLTRAVSDGHDTRAALPPKQVEPAPESAEVIVPKPAPNTEPDPIPAPVAEPKPAPPASVSPSMPVPKTATLPSDDPAGVVAVPQLLDEEKTEPPAYAPEPAKRPNIGTGADGGWKVIFSGRDPAAWNTDGSADTLAQPLRTIPRDIRFLRLKRLDNGDAIIIPISYNQLNIKISYRNNALPVVRWNGGNENVFGGRHLGIVSGPISPIDRTGHVAVQMEGFDCVYGSGFGHIPHGGDSEQHFAWRGEPIPPTAFEIAVSSGNLRPSERDKFVGGSLR